MRRLWAARVLAMTTAVSVGATTGWAQSTGTVRGTVTLMEDGGPVHGAVVLIVGPGLVGLTDDDGAFVIDDVPAGSYEILAQREHLTAERQMITVASEQSVDVNFVLGLSPIHEEVTVTATPGGTVTTFEAFNAVTTLDSFELVTNPVGTVGELLEHEPGMAKRSFGPGSSRPIIRGFDGDRVLVMEDGIRTGDLSSQSGDHGVTIDPNSLERVEVVRGPATLLYGSNSVGGVVNTITPQESYGDALAGTRGQFGFDAGTANNQVGTTASLQHGQGRLRFWASGSARRTDDYDTPEGPIENSATRSSTGRAGIGYAGPRLFASGGFSAEDARYGVPFAGAFESDAAVVTGGASEGGPLIDLDTRRRVGRFDVGMRQLDTAFLDSFRLVVNVIDWQHDELETEEGIETRGTRFDNRTYIVRADLNQPPTDRLTGRFGAWSQFRSYMATGEEALAPPTDQTALAAFAYEELDVGRFRVQFGGRVERNAYTVAAREADAQSGDAASAPEGGQQNLLPPEVRNRGFTGMSASVGLHTDLGAGNRVVANLTHSHRAPALEELYNFGPHVGNLAFEIGNPDLDAETTLGLDLSLRHQSDGVRGDFNVYVYDIRNFVFLDLQDEMVDNLRLAEYVQGDSRFTGFDAKASVRLGSRIWANVGLGFVDAELTTTNESLPRIPPFQGSLSVDVPFRGFTVTPELIFAGSQKQVFRDETETAGYGVLNLRASHVWPMSHMAHILTVSGYNLTNELYRNHTSFIKDLAPEIGRGVKAGYSLRFF